MDQEERKRLFRERHEQEERDAYNEFLYCLSFSIVLVIASLFLWGTFWTFFKIIGLE